MRIVAVTSFIVAAAYNAPLAQRPAAPAENQRPATGVAPSQQAVLAKYCVTCHNQRAKTGGLALDTLDLADVPNHAEEWEKVVRKVRTGAMPPVGRRATGQGDGGQPRDVARGRSSIALRPSGESWTSDAAASQSQ